MDEKEKLVENIKWHFAKRELHKLKEDAALSSRLALEERGDEEMLHLAILSYALAQMVEKGHFINSSEWMQFSEKIVSQLALLKDENKLQAILSLIWDFSEKHGRFVTNVVEKAKLKVGTQLYAHGASLGLAANLAHIDKNELLSYISATHLNEKYVTMPVSQRLLKIFKKLGEKDLK